MIKKFLSGRCAHCGGLCEYNEIICAECFEALPKIKYRCKSCGHALQVEAYFCRHAKINSL